MNEEELLSSLREILRNCLDNGNEDYSSLTMDTDIFETYHITSISALYLALEIENAFSISLLNEDAAKIRTPKHIKDLIEEKKAR